MHSFGILKRVHIDQRVLRENANTGSDLPPVTVETALGSAKAHEVVILGESKVVYDGSQLNCGAICWVETEAEVVLLLR